MKNEKIIDDENNLIGKNIREIRKREKIGQTELVRKLQLIEVEMTRETLVKIERGIQHIKLSQLRGIKEILEVEYSDLLD